MGRSGCWLLVAAAAAAHALFAAASEGAMVMALALLAATGALAAPAAVWATRRAGPSNVMRRLPVGWAFLHFVLAMDALLALPRPALLVWAVLAGALSALTASAVLAGSAGRAAPLAVAIGIVGAVASSHALPGGPGWAATAAIIVLFVAWTRLPLPSDPDPLARIVPWGDQPTPTGWRRFRAPGLAAYLVLSWAWFVSRAGRTPSGWQVESARLALWAYRLPDLIHDFPAVLLRLLSAPIVQADHIQAGYVTLLLLLFGVPFEAREGTLRAVALFFGTSFVGGIVAGLVHAALYPAVFDGPVWTDAAQRLWTGGSAGAFGLVGAATARARRPWPLLAFLVFWEFNVGWFYLQRFTPAFHLSALVVGFIAVRWAPRRVDREA